MLNKQYTGELLDDLQVITCLEYLSELKDPRNRKKALQGLKQFYAPAYSLKQWSAALTYITGQDMTLSGYDGAKECVDALLAAFSEENP